jgi:steroid 5-alpha reductase family enzyme
MIVLLILSVTIMLSLLMMLAWAVQRRTGNAGWVDVVWTFALGLAGILYALAPAPAIAWPGRRQVLVAALVALWSVRLGVHLWDRTRKGPEDVRYAQFRRDWGAAYPRRMFGFLQIQAAAAALLAVSILLAARNPHPLGIQDGIALLVLATAVVGEAIADAQLRRFRADPANHGKVCDTGLWRLSRHPNYFFEWFGWLAYPLFAVDPGGTYPAAWIALSGPALMYWLLVHVSGIPPLEQQMLRTRGETYRAYQARTRAFVPLPFARMP